MKNYTHLMLFAALLFAFSCKQAPDSDKAKVGEAQTASKPAAQSKNLKVDVSQSFLTWVGTKPTGQHQGQINIKSGTLSATGADVTAGSFVIDLATVAAKDMDAENNGKLSGHLMSADFFDVENHPQGKFVITKVKPYKQSGDGDTKLSGTTHMISGNLTMKGVTKSVTFPARVKYENNVLSAVANFNINRTDWGLVYGNDKSLGDKFIRPMVNIGLKLSAK